MKIAAFGSLEGGVLVDGLVLVPEEGEVFGPTEKEAVGPTTSVSSTPPRT